MIYTTYFFFVLSHMKRNLYSSCKPCKGEVDFLGVLWVFFARFSGFNKGLFNKCKREGGMKSLGNSW